MAKLAKAFSGVIWEQCVKLEKCVHIGWPINKDICVSVGACLRLIEQNGAIILQVEAGGQQFNLPLANACHVIFSVGVGTIEICIEPRGANSVRLQARACIHFGPINDCWDIWGTDVHWITGKELAGLPLEEMGLGSLDQNALPTYVGLAHEYLPVPTPAKCRCGHGD